MKKVELIERVKRKIDELGTTFDHETYLPSGEIAGNQ